jgi:hypothetical protein
MVRDTSVEVAGLTVAPMAAAVGTTPVGAAAAAVAESGFHLRRRLRAVAAAAMVPLVMVAVVMAVMAASVMAVSVIVVGNF